MLPINQDSARPPSALNLSRKYQSGQQVQVVQNDFLEPSFYMKVGEVLGYTGNRRKFVMVRIDDKCRDFPEDSLCLHEKQASPSDVKEESVSPN